jgi:hypothetical protein
MSNSLPPFVRSSAGAVASYSWEDLTQALGYRRYYAIALANSTGYTYSLLSKTIDASTSGATKIGYYSTAAGASDLDVDFDITFGFPVQVAGATAFVNYSMAVYDSAHVYAIVNIYHVTSGGTETLIGTTTGTTYDHNGTKYYRDTIAVELTTKHFAIGEKLRVNIYLEKAGTNGSVDLFHDPSSLTTYTDKDSRTIGSDLTVDIPFKIDLS